MLKTISISLKQLLRQYQLVVLYYFIVLVLGILVARPVYVTILNEANKSIALDALIADFDFMIFSDFMHHSWAAFRPLVSLVAVLVFLFFLISNFFQGGLLKTMSSDQFRYLDFFEGGLQMWGRFLILSIYSFIFLVVLVAFSGMFFFIFAAVAEGGNERTYILSMLPPVLILGIFISFVIVQNQYAKVIMSQNASTGPWEAFGKAFTYVFKNPKALLMYWIILILVLLVLFIYLCIDSLIGMKSGMTIFFMFVVQQIYVLSRSWLNLGAWAVAQNYFLSKLVVLSEPQIQIHADTDNTDSAD